MMLSIGGVLDAEHLGMVKALIQTEDFRDGKSTAGWWAQTVKNNEQLHSGSRNYSQLQDFLVKVLRENELFALAAMPKELSPILISRYSMGMRYGNHVDNALMGTHPRIRTDISYTLFLNEPAEYDGGELIIEDSAGCQSIRLPAGCLAMYPSTFMHRVEPVTRGQRIVAVGWVQSLVRNADQRQIIFDIETVRRELFARNGKSPAVDTLSKTASNLWRMWLDI